MTRARFSYVSGGPHGIERDKSLGSIAKVSEWPGGSRRRGGTCVPLATNFREGPDLRTFRFVLSHRRLISLAMVCLALGIQAAVTTALAAPPGSCASPTAQKSPSPAASPAPLALPSLMPQSSPSPSPSPSASSCSPTPSSNYGGGVSAANQQLANTGGGQALIAAFATAIFIVVVATSLWVRRARGHRQL
jgi:hypothetical protein